MVVPLYFQLYFEYKIEICKQTFLVPFFEWLGKSKFCFIVDNCRSLLITINLRFNK